ncbi:MAG: 3-isopropylmalate dehydratase small subunit [Patescibacteria group bacterium]|mgnify:CR=1 FL=1
MMKNIRSKIVPIPRKDIDTDLIISAEFLTVTDKKGLGEHVFERLRVSDPDFPLNFEKYKGAEILVARSNFGCGSSREHAAWALFDYGIKVVIAPSFSDIFYSNAMKNGILPLILEEKTVEEIFEDEAMNSGEYVVSVDLPNQIIELADGQKYEFKIDPYRKECLIKGMDDMDYLLENIAEINKFDKKHKNFIFFDTKNL